MTDEGTLFCAHSVSKLKDCLSDAPGFLFFLNRDCTVTVFVLALIHIYIFTYLSGNQKAEQYSYN